jgi:hypothetical protein
MNRLFPMLMLLATAWLGSAAQAAEPSGAMPSAAVARDPTVPPLAARAAALASSGAGATTASAEPGALPRHLMVLNGKPYVIERGWPRGVGDKLGEARIERIAGGNVWLRDASGTRKLSLYPGVEIHPSVAAPTVTAHATGKHSTHATSTRARRTDNPATLATKDPLP